MTVDELRKQLDPLDGDTLVVMSSDEEGNSFSPLAKVGQSRYVPEQTWCGDLVNSCDSPEPVEGEVPAVVLWPVN